MAPSESSQGSFPREKPWSMHPVARRILGARLPQENCVWLLCRLTSLS